MNNNLVEQAQHSIHHVHELIHRVFTDTDGTGEATAFASAGGVPARIADGPGGTRRDGPRQASRPQQPLRVRWTHASDSL